MTTKFKKDPDAVLDYTVDWEDFLGTDTISASAWTVDTGLTVDDSSQFTDTTAILWVSGGIVGTTYDCTNHITTAAGREDDRTFKIKIVEK